MSNSKNHSGAENRSHSALERRIGLPGAVSLGTGTMIAAGIFILSGLAVAKVGAMAVVSFLVASIIASFTGAVYAEFASIYPEDGGGYAFVDNVWNTDLTYLMGWCMIIGYPASAAFYLVSFSKWFQKFISPQLFMGNSIPYWMSGIAVLLILVVINVIGTEESSEFQVVVTAVKIGLLVLFLAGGLQAFETEVIFESIRENITEFRNIGMTTTLVFITFFGFEAIATEAGEIKKPETYIPYGIFLSILIVTVLYIAVVLVLVLAVRDREFLQFLIAKSRPETISEARSFVAQNGELAMGRAAQYYLGNTGFYLFVTGVLASMISAANATVLGGSRVKLSMARRNHLPALFQSINSRFGTPMNAVLLTGVIILTLLLLFTVLPLPFPNDLVAERWTDRSLGIESLAHMADFLLLIGLTMVNLSLIESRRKEPDRDRPFRVPFVPVVPLFGALFSIVLLFHVKTPALIMGMICLCVGALLWPLWRSPYA